MSGHDPIAALPGCPRDAEGPVFAAPWHAQAFAMAVSLNQRGVFTWTEWADCLGAEIAAASAEGQCEDGDSYYRHWLAALEKLVAAKGLASAADLERRRRAWDRAARSTPHGQPISLAAGD